jgi:3D (Asp-Asp-Asp) domain-containing protein
MSYTTSSTQALAGNLSRIASAIMPMFDPSVAAQAEQVRRERQLFPLKYRAAELENDLTLARTGTEGAQAGYYNAQTGLTGDKRVFQQTQNRALGDLYGGGPLPSSRPAAGPFIAPTTSYSLGADVGGPDEMQDKWTNRGYSSTGKNLTPGMVAVNDKVHPLGTVFRDPQSGEVFIAGDRHGNADPNVIDFYQEPAAYKGQSGNRTLEVIGRESKVGATPEAVQAQRQKWAQVLPIPNHVPGDYQVVNLPAVPGSGEFLPLLDGSNLPPDAIPTENISTSGVHPEKVSFADQARLAAVAGLNPETFVGGQARAQALQGGFDESRGREIALAQGLLPSQTTAITPEFQIGRDVMANSADLNQAATVAGINQQGNLAATELQERYGLARHLIPPLYPTIARRGDGSMASPLAPGAPRTFADMQKLEEEAAQVSFHNFGVPMSDEGQPENDPYAGVRRAWQESYLNLRKAGHSRADAAATANVHHFGNPAPGIQSADTFRFGFGQDPSMPEVQNTNPLVVQGGQPELPQGGNFAAEIPMILQSLGLADAPQETAVPVTGAEAPKAQEAAIPQTGPMPSGKRMGDEKKAKEDAESAAVGSAYNDKTIQKLLQSGVPIEDIAASAFAGDEGNASALADALTPPPSMTDVNAYGMRGMAPHAPVASTKDIRNALLDANALQRAGIDPAVIRQYIPGAAPQKIGRFIVE